MPIGSDLIDGLSNIWKRLDDPTGVPPQDKIGDDTGAAAFSDERTGAVVAGHAIKNFVTSLWEDFKFPGEVAAGKYRVTPEEPGKWSEMDEERQRSLDQEFTRRAVGLGVDIGLGGASRVPKAGRTIESPKPAPNVVMPAQRELQVTGRTPEGATRIEPVEGQPAAPDPGAVQKEQTAVSPTKAVVTATSDDLHRLRQSVTADKLEIGQHLETMPPEFKTAEMQEKFYQKLERPEMQLSPGEQAVFEKYIEPMRQEIQALSARAGRYGMPLEDSEWVHRVMKGKEGDLPVDTGGASEIPQLGTRTLPQKTSAMMPRNLYALEAEDGRRAVVSQPRPGMLTVWNKGKPQTVKWGDDLELGNPIMVQGKKFTVKQAKTSELESETPYRYQKSAAVNMGDALVKMRAVVRNIEYLDSLTKTPDWMRWATKDVRKAPRDWVKPDIPQLQEWRVHPKLAGPLDDFYSPNIEQKGYLEPLRRVNRFAVGSLFWNPIPHIENVLGHWYVGRGFDWLRPTAYYSLFKDGARAIKETATMGKDYQDLLRHGSGIISGGVHNADFYRVLAKKFGLEVQQNAGEWQQIANKLGMGLPDLVKAWYGGMNRILWQANDVFMLQRVFELERQGLSRAAAITEAEKHIPNYRVPPEVLGSRMFSKMIQDPAITSFGRYHYGVWNSYANMVRDLVGKGKTLEERNEAVGNMLALASLTFLIYPAVSYGIQKLTGDDSIKKLPRGPAAIPSAIYDAATSGEKQWYDIIGNSITLAPVFKEGLQQMTNRDFFTGQHIEEPGETSKARRATQRVEHAAQSLVAPYAQGSQIAKSIQEKGVPREVLKQVIGTQDKTAAQQRGAAKGRKIERGQAKARRKKPRGIIEQFGGSLE